MRTEFTLLVKETNEHLLQLLVFFILRADMDYNRVNPLSQ